MNRDSVNNTAILAGRQPASSDPAARGLSRFVEGAAQSVEAQALLDERSLAVEVRCGTERHRLALGAQRDASTEPPPDVVVVADELSVEAIFGGNLRPEDAWTSGLCMPWAGRSRDVLHLVALLAAIYA